jgi:putative Mn2+ efflux pump MntP
MSLLSLTIIALALAMDAFAVALATGLTLPQLTGRHLFRFGFHFGLFQGLMPILGWLAGASLRHQIDIYDHWIAFALLCVVGIKMLKDAYSQEDENKTSVSDPTKGLSLILLSIATSIDALAVGLSLSLFGVSIWLPAFVIGVTAALLTLCGMLLGRHLNSNWGKRVEVLGGLLLIAVGSKILATNIFII